MENDSRFLKQAQSLLSARVADQVVLVGRSNRLEPSEQQVEEGIKLLRFQSRLAALPKFKLFGFLKYLELIYHHVLAAKRIAPSIIQCHSVSSLLGAVLAGRVIRAPVVYDARELETECNGLTGARQAFLRMIERALIRRCDSVMCVSDSIADWYARNYKICRPFVVRNIPDVRTQSRAVNPDVLRVQFRIPYDALIFIYSGGLYHGRRVEQMIRVFQQLKGDQHLVFMGFGPLEDLVRKASTRCARIHFLPAVAPAQVLGHLAGADVGIVGVESKCLSYRLSLPNKLFEYIFSGIPFLAADYPEMRRVVDTFQCGWLVGEMDSQWLEAIGCLDKVKTLAKRGLVDEAKRHFSWENEAENLKRAYTNAGMG
jgi:glycosyltransferase involved in cell wall biosynthesis